MSINLKEVKEKAVVEEIVAEVTEKVKKVFNVSQLELSVWLREIVYYEAQTRNGDIVVIEVNVNTFETYVLLTGKGWRYLGNINKK